MIRIFVEKQEKDFKLSLEQRSENATHSVEYNIPYALSENDFVSFCSTVHDWASAIASSRYRL